MANGFVSVPKEKFEFVNHGERISDKKFEDKPIGYFKDAWIRFRKNKGSIVAALIILAMMLFSLLAPVVITSHDATFLDGNYAKKGPRNILLSKIGIATGTTDRSFNERGLIKLLAVGMAAEDKDGTGQVTLEEGFSSYYQPIRKYDEGTERNEIIGVGASKVYAGVVDSYMEVGFIYRSVEQAEYARIKAWQEETGIQVLYPLIDTGSKYCPDPSDANYWYKAKSNGTPLKENAGGNVKSLSLQEGLVLDDNYKRDADGNPVYYEYTGGGTHETAQFKIRVLYYNYYQYKNGFEPEYLFGTDSQGYDLTLRLAGGIRLSLMLAISVSAINLVLGAILGAIQGYYGGAVDLFFQRVTDVLSGMPFIVVATLFQLHLSQKVGVVVCLLFAYVLTGWIGPSHTVRTQFYRFKNQEYVLAARTLGASDWRIIWKHVFPNALGTIITASVLVIPGTINSESTLSYLGIVKLGSANVTSLGTLLSDASSLWTNYPHLLFFPALVISLLMICFNLFGNGLRDAFNPSLRGVED